MISYPSKSLYERRCKKQIEDQARQDAAELFRKFEAEIKEILYRGMSVDVDRNWSDPTE